MRVTAIARAVAALGGLKHVFILTEIKECLCGKGCLIFGISKIFVHFVRENDFPRIENMVWIPKVFYCFKKLVIPGADHKLNKFCAYASIAMLTTQRALVFPDKLCA